MGWGGGERYKNNCAIARKQWGKWPRDFRSETAELNRRVQVTATNSWRPTPTEKMGREDAYQVAAPTETRTPTMHRANIAHQDQRLTRPEARAGIFRRTSRCPARRNELSRLD